jgi:cytochrome P450
MNDEAYMDLAIAKARDGIAAGPDMLPDPYPTFRRLRQADPVHWHAPLGAWMLTRYDDVDAALRDSRLSNTLGDVIPGRLPGERDASEFGWQTLRSL